MYEEIEGHATKETAVSGSADSPEAVSDLQSRDWNEEWKRLQRVRRKFDDSQYWNKRSKNFDAQGKPNPYARDFLALSRIPSGSTVLDMGCGTGSIAVPLALTGCRVVAGDFSQGMLDEMARRIDAAGGATVEPKLVSWDDDWNAHGLGANAVDYAIASRSISTFDLRASLQKLTHVAAKRCFITLPCGSSPRMDPVVLRACGVENRHGSDFQYAWNILANDGYWPTARYITSTRKDTFDSADEAFCDFDRMLTDVLGPEDSAELANARALLREWLAANLVPNENVGKIGAKGWPEKKLRLQSPRIITWGFIAWNVDKSVTV